MHGYTGGSTPTYDAKLLLNGIALMENTSVGRLLYAVNKEREVAYSLYDYMDNLPLPLDLKQSLRLRYQKDKMQSDIIMQQCYSRSIYSLRRIILWLLPVFVVLLILI